MKRWKECECPRMEEVTSDRYYRELCSSETLRSGTKGFFRNFIEVAVNKAGSSWINNIFGKLEHDDQRIRAIFTHPPIKDYLLDTLDRVKHLYRAKDAHISRARRLEGIELTSAGDLHRGLGFLSQAVLRAPMTGQVKSIDDGYSLPLALLARANALIILKEYEFAVSDLKAAAEEDILSTDIRSQIDTQLKESQRLHAESCLGVESLDTTRKNHYRKPDTPNLTGGPSTISPYLSSLIGIRDTPSAGKHAVASGKIRVGDTLAVEPPLASNLLPDYYGTHCHHCFVRLRAPVGCSLCSTVAFCRDKCRHEAIETYHKYECKILVLLIGSGMSVLSTLALRMITQVGYETSLRLYEKCKEYVVRDRVNQSSPSGIVQKFDTLHMSESAKRQLKREKHIDEKASTKDTSERVDSRAYQLIGHESLRTPSDFFERTLMAAFLLKCLTIVDFFGTSKENMGTPTEEEIRIASLLLRNLQLLQFNAHEIFETRSTNGHQFRSNKTIYLGVAIYPSVARFNHDCYPAVTRYFAGHDIIIRATRPLKPGDVVAENYGPIFTKRSLRERQRVLTGRYWFKCTCRACQENWPSFDDLANYVPRIRCTSKGCEGLVHQLPEGKTSLQCSLCQREINVENRLTTLAECVEGYERGFTNMDLGKLDEAVHDIVESIEKFHTIAWPPHRDTHLAEIALASCMSTNGNTWNVSGG